MEECLSAPQVHFVLADSRMMLQDHVHAHWTELLRNVLQVGGLPGVGLLLQSERVLLDPLTSLVTGDSGNELGVDLLELPILQVLGESQVRRCARAPWA